jgi:hypothetical protein
MGMYTEIFINADLIEETPPEVIQTLKAICNKEQGSPFLQDHPNRWSILFNNGSYYLPCTECGILTYDDISKRYSIIGKGDLKNYDNEIEKFFEWVKPWCEGNFIGYYRYEEDYEPTLIYKKEVEES